MIRRIRTLLTGLTALATLGAVLIGLPAVLYRFGGSPLPRHWAGWHHIASVLTSRDNGTMLLAVIRDCSWVAWLAFAVAVAAEAQAALRGRAAPRLRLGAVQGSAARLVALAALTFTAPTAVTLSASAATIAPVHVGNLPGSAGARIQATDMAYLAATSTASPGVQTATATRLVTVRPGDCLWSIAQHYLGAGDEYPEIASMNYGHDMGDGQTFKNPSLILPGWQLRVPAGGNDSGSAAMSDGAPHHLGHPTHDPHFGHRHGSARSNKPASPSPASPSAASPSPASTAAPGAQASGSALGQSASANGYQTSADVAAPSGEHLPESAIFAAGALAGAVLTSLTRLRRRQRQYRRRGRRIALPTDPNALAAEQRLRAAAGEPITSLQDALTCLEDGITSTGQVLPDIVGLHVTPTMLEVLLASPAPDSPPSPYTITPGRQGMCWQLALPASEHAGPGGLSARGSGLLPGLFTAGGTDAGYLLLDLESLQVTGCDGPPALVDQVITAAATELATGQWSGWYELILVGFAELDILGRAEHYASLDEALSQLDERAAAVSRRLAAEPPADLRQLRLTAPEDEDWGLTILVSRVEPSADQMMHLLELTTNGPSGIAALVAGDPETADAAMAPTVLQLAPDPEHAGEILANVIPLQISVRPQRLSPAEYEAISTLFAVATDLEDVSAEEQPYALYGAPPWIPQADNHDGNEAPAWHTADEFLGSQWPEQWSEEDDQVRWPVLPDTVTPVNGVFAPPWVTGVQAPPAPNGTRKLEIQVLGPFTVRGAVEQLQPKQGELVLALALAAPAGLSNSALCTMLGADPDHPKPSDAVRQIITRTRRRLGRATDGQEYIIHAGNGSYLLHPDATLDWTGFRELVATSRAEEMRAALAMVRGEPFTGSLHWWIDIPLLETVRAEIVDAAETLGEFELATGSARAAARAVRAGLTAESSAEQLWRLLMRAEHAAGNLAGVAEAWRHCLDAIEDIAPGGEPHPDTEALYRQLSATSRQHVPATG